MVVSVVLCTNNSDNNIDSVSGFQGTMISGETSVFNTAPAPKPSVVDAIKACERNSSLKGDSSHDMRLLPEGFQPGEHDVICGRGRRTFNHKGNEAFRSIVRSFLPEYSRAVAKLEKSYILSDVVEQVRKNSGIGGFVKKDPNSGRWFEVGDFLAREKTSQAFRDVLHEKYKSSNTAKKKRRQEEQAGKLFRNHSSRSLGDGSVSTVASSFTDSNTEDTSCLTSDSSTKFMRIERPDYFGQANSSQRSLGDDLLGNLQGMTLQQRSSRSVIDFEPSRASPLTQAAESPVPEWYNSSCPNLFFDQASSRSSSSRSLVSGGADGSERFNRMPQFRSASTRSLLGAQQHQRNSSSSSHSLNVVNDQRSSSSRSLNGGGERYMSMAERHSLLDSMLEDNDGAPEGNMMEKMVANNHQPAYNADWMHHSQPNLSAVDFLSVRSPSSVSARRQYARNPPQRRLPPRAPSDRGLSHRPPRAPVESVQAMPPASRGTMPPLGSIGFPSQQQQQQQGPPAELFLPEESMRPCAPGSAGVMHQHGRAPPEQVQAMPPTTHAEMARMRSNSMSSSQGRGMDDVVVMGGGRSSSNSNEAYHMSFEDKIDQLGLAGAGGGTGGGGSGHQMMDISQNSHVSQHATHHDSYNRDLADIEPFGLSPIPDEGGGEELPTPGEDLLASLANLQESFASGNGDDPFEPDPLPGM